MRSGLSLGILGAGSLLGEALEEALDERPFPIQARTRFAAEPDAEGDAEPLTALLERAPQLLLLADATPVPEPLLAAYTARGGRVLDLTGEHPAAVAAPLVWAPDAVPEAARLRLPAPTALALAPLLAALTARLGPLLELRLTLLQAVSGAGREGVEELGQQTAALLNFRGFTPRRFSRQIAFNLLTAEPAEVDRIRAQLAGLPGLETAELTASLYWLPVFYGLTVIADLEWRRAIRESVVVEALASLPGVRRGERLDPVGEASGQPGLALRWPVALQGSTGRLRLEFTLDNVRAGIIEPGLRIAARLAAGSRPDS